ncbi:hypothetical protein KO317_03005 [Candidatus Micrarchaeota archaeon]|jgi:hypothetical protein|nr:hypothetical protein [Candidatus Micrarchaeota archaeon]
MKTITENKERYLNSDVPKLKKIPIFDQQIGKTTLSQRELRILFSGKVIVEEIFDGGYTKFCFNNRFILWTTDMLKRGKIKYRLPARYFVFGILDLQNMHMLKKSSSIEIVNEIKERKKPIVNLNLDTMEDYPHLITCPPNLFSGKITLEELEVLIKKESEFGVLENNTKTPIKGIFVKSDMEILYFSIPSFVGSIITDEFQNLPELNKTELNIIRVRKNK